MRKLKGNGESDRMGKWGKGEKWRFTLHFLMLSSFSLYFLIFSPFSHSLAIFSLSISLFSLHFLILSPFSHYLAIFSLRTKKVLLELPVHFHHKTRNIQSDFQQIV